MWTEEEFNDKLVMMRDALETYENKLQELQNQPEVTPGQTSGHLNEENKKAEEVAFDAFTKEIFDIDVDTIDFQEDFLANLTADLDVDTINEKQKEDDYSDAYDQGLLF